MSLSRRPSAVRRTRETARRSQGVEGARIEVVAPALPLAWGEAAWEARRRLAGGFPSDAGV